MVPWIQVYSNLPHHPKVARLADELGLPGTTVNPNVVATGILVSLWSWAAQNCVDGDLRGCSDRVIADACQWTKKAETLVQALVACGFLDKDRKIHDWDEYAWQRMQSEDEQRAKTRERVRKYRSRNADVTPV